MQEVERRPVQQILFLALQDLAGGIIRLNDVHLFIQYKNSVQRPVKQQLILIQIRFQLGVFFLQSVQLVLQI